MKNNAQDSIIIFLVLSVAIFLFVGKYHLEQLFTLVPICFIIGVSNFVYEEIKRRKESKLKMYSEFFKNHSDKLNKMNVERFTIISKNSVIIHF